MLFLWSEWDTNSGGSRSLHGSFETLEEAREAWAPMKEDHAQVLDLDTGVWIKPEHIPVRLIPRVMMDDVVHDDHTRAKITRLWDKHPRPGVWNVMAGDADVEGGVSTHFEVVRLPALDSGGRRAWTPDLDAVRAVR
jgi:hypothetical protein